LPGRRRFAALNDLMDRPGPHEVNAMTAHTEVPAEVTGWPPRFINWLAVIVLLSLGVLL
jgi:hypothetical protein